MRRLFHKLSLKQALVGICMATAALAVLIATAMLTVMAVMSYRHQASKQLLALSAVIAAHSQAPLQFGDEAVARETLESLHDESAIVFACTLDAQNKVLAEYRIPGEKEHRLLPPDTALAQVVESAGYLDAFHPVLANGRRIGTVAVRYSRAELEYAIRRLVLTSVAVMLLALVSAFMLASRLRNIIAQPLGEIIDTAQGIRGTGNYAARARVAVSSNELDAVVDAFNSMLAQIELRDQALRAANEDLEERVQERTEALEQENAERGLVEDALRGSQASFHNLVNMNTDGIVVVTGNGRIGFLNPAGAEFLSKASEGDVYPWDLPDGPDEAATVLIPGTETTVEYTATPTEWAGSPATLITIRDVSHRRSLESQLLQSQKMEAIGRLAGGIAHDFNNLLTAILGYSDLLLTSLPEGSEQRADAEVIRRAADRARALTRQLLTFSRRQVVQLRVLNINDVVTDSDRILRRLIGEDIELVSVLGDSRPCVEADAGLLEQVLMNLVVNARDAMPNGGKVTVRVQRIQVEEDGKPFPGARKGQYVCLAVSDTGCGISPEIQEKIFEPFFTTKGVGEGTGLGLSTVYGIVSELSGGITVESQVGQGTTFRIFLPTTSKRISGLDTVVMPVPHLAGGHILVVEDEEIVRQLVCTVLRTRGYEVRQCLNVDDALNALEQENGRFDLIITDVVMPGRSGRALGEEVAQLYPDLPVLFMSGYTDDRVLRHGISRSEHEFLQKPFTAAGLLARVNMILEQREETATANRTTPPG